MFIKPSKKWRNPEGDQTIMVPYTYYRLCESYREADGKVKRRSASTNDVVAEVPLEARRMAYRHAMGGREGVLRAASAPQALL